MHVAKLSRAESKMLDHIGKAQYDKAHPKTAKNAPIYRDMQKEVDVIKYKNRRELKLKYY